VDGYCQQQEFCLSKSIPLVGMPVCDQTEDVVNRGRLLVPNPSNKHKNTVKVPWTHQVFIVANSLTGKHKSFL